MCQLQCIAKLSSVKHKCVNYNVLPSRTVLI